MVIVCEQYFDVFLPAAPVGLRQGKVSPFEKAHMQWSKVRVTYHLRL